MANNEIRTAIRDIIMRPGVDLDHLTFKIVRQQVCEQLSISFDQIDKELVKSITKEMIVEKETMLETPPLNPQMTVVEISDDESLKTVVDKPKRKYTRKPKTGDPQMTMVEISDESFKTVVDKPKRKYTRKPKGDPPTVESNKISIQLDEYSMKLRKEFLQIIGK
jgi:hypothetical protein